MKPMTLRRIGGWILAASLVAVGASATQPAAETDAPLQETPRELRGRLPAYYRLVVSEAQRLQIYRIQAEYRARIESLEAELKRLKQQRDARIADVLSEEQKKKMEKAIAESKAKRAAKANKKAAASTETDTGTPRPGTLPDNGH